MMITVNGEAFALLHATISHETICEMAREPAPATITYEGRRVGDTQRSGVLSAGKTIEADDGMIFNCVRTRNV